MTDDDDDDDDDDGFILSLCYLLPSVRRLHR
jgi:hypothetical protein